MVLIPWGRDQPGVAARAAALGAAEVVPRDDASAEGIGSAINRVLGDDEMRRKTAGQSTRLQATNPAAAAAARIESLL